MLLANSFVRAEDKLVALLGVEHMVIVSTKDVTLVAHKDRVQDAKVVAADLEKEGALRVELNREVHRPWGKYDSIDRGRVTR